MNEDNETMDAVLDNAWGDEDGAGFGGETEGQDGTTNTAEGQSAADQPKETEPAVPELFTLKNRDETRQVSRDEMIALAQKGWDYDTVRAERDQLRQYRQEADPALAVIQSYARRNGMDVPQYLDFCRKQELMRGGMTEQDAAVKLGMEKERAALDARQAEIQASAQRQAQEAAQARRRDIELFCRTYPGVDPKTISREVWEAVKGGDTLTNAFTKHENRRLTAELAAEQQNRANRLRTPGALGANSGAEWDEMDRLWSEDD